MNLLQLDLSWPADLPPDVCTPRDSGSLCILCPFQVTCWFRSGPPDELLPF